MLDELKICNKNIDFKTLWDCTMKHPVGYQNIPQHGKSAYPLYMLTHLPLDKTATFSQTIVSGAFSWMKNFIFWYNISQKFVPKGPIDNNPALV